MKSLRNVISIILLTLMGLVSFAVAVDGAVPADDVASQVKALWVDSNLTGLRSYLVPLEADYPDFVPAVVASAFYDSVFCGKLNQAQAKLVRLQNASTANPQSYSDDFKIRLGLSIQFINDEIRIQTNHGKTESDWQAKADPQAVRNLWEEHLLPFLDLLAVSPKTTLPSN